jgi:hypothetical protein
MTLLVIAAILGMTAIYGHEMSLIGAELDQ